MGMVYTGGTADVSTIPILLLTGVCLQLTSVATAAITKVATPNFASGVPIACALLARQSFKSSLDCLGVSLTNLNTYAGSCNYSMCSSNPTPWHDYKLCRGDKQACVCDSRQNYLSPAISSPNTTVQSPDFGCCGFNLHWDASIGDCQCNDTTWNTKDNLIVDPPSSGGLGIGCCPNKSHYRYNSSSQQCVCVEDSTPSTNGDCVLNSDTQGLSREEKIEIAVPIALGVPALLLALISAWAAIAALREGVTGPADTFRRLTTRRHTQPRDTTAGTKLAPAPASTLAAPLKTPCSNPMV